MAPQKNYDKINIGETCYKTQLTTKYKNWIKWERPNKMQVLAFIPGTIVEIFVKKGQEVEVGEDLLVLEAMKMKNRVKSPVNAKIKSIKVKKSQVVPKNFLLIEFKEK